MSIEIIQKEYDRLLARQTLLLIDNKTRKKETIRIRREVSAHTEARDTITKVIQLTQYKIKKSIEKIVTLAIRSVFYRPYTFHLTMKQIRNQIEYIPTVKEHGHIRDPKADLGGGIMDIIALAFRIVLWSIEVPRSRALLILDQPFPNCGSLIVRAGAMAKELSQELKIQLLIITHEKKLAQIADRTWEFIHDGTKSIIHRKLKRR